MVKTMTNHDDLGWPISRQSFSNPSCWGFSHAKCSEFWYSNRPIWSCKLVIKVFPKKKRAWCVMTASTKNCHDLGSCSSLVFHFVPQRMSPKRPVRSHRRRHESHLGSGPSDVGISPGSSMWRKWRSSLVAWTGGWSWQRSPWWMTPSFLGGVLKLGDPQNQRFRY